MKLKGVKGKWLQDHEQEERERQQRAEAEKQEQERQLREAAEALEREEQRKQEEEQRQREEQRRRDEENQRQREEDERRAAAERQRLEEEERRKKEEAERKAREEAERVEAERRAKEEAERQQQEAEQERLREEQERKEAQRKAEVARKQQQLELARKAKAAEELELFAPLPQKPPDAPKPAALLKPSAFAQPPHASKTAGSQKPPIKPPAKPVEAPKPATKLPPGPSHQSNSSEHRQSSPPIQHTKAGTTQKAQNTRPGDSLAKAPSTSACAVQDVLKQPASAPASKQPSVNLDAPARAQSLPANSPPIKQEAAPQVRTTATTKAGNSNSRSLSNLQEQKQSSPADTRPQNCIPAHKQHKQPSTSRQNASHPKSKQQKHAQPDRSMSNSLKHGTAHKHIQGTAEATAQASAESNEDNRKVIAGSKVVQSDKDAADAPSKVARGKRAVLLTSSSDDEEPTSDTGDKPSSASGPSLQQLQHGTGKDRKAMLLSLASKKAREQEALKEQEASVSTGAFETLADRIKRGRRAAAPADFGIPTQRRKTSRESTPATSQHTADQQADSDSDVAWQTKERSKAATIPVQRPHPHQVAAARPPKPSPLGKKASKPNELSQPVGESSKPVNRQLLPSTAVADDKQAGGTGKLLSFGSSNARAIEEALANVSQEHLREAPLQKPTAAVPKGKQGATHATSKLQHPQKDTSVKEEPKDGSADSSSKDSAPHGRTHRAGQLPTEDSCNSQEQTHSSEGRTSQQLNQPNVASHGTLTGSKRARNMLDAAAANEDPGQHYRGSHARLPDDLQPTAKRPSALTKVDLAGRAAKPGGPPVAPTTSTAPTGPSVKEEPKIVTKLGVDRDAAAGAAKQPHQASAAQRAADGVLAAGTTESAGTLGTKDHRQSDCGGNRPSKLVACTVEDYSEEHVLDLYKVRSFKELWNEFVRVFTSPLPDKLDAKLVYLDIDGDWMMVTRDESWQNFIIKASKVKITTSCV